MVRQCSDIWLSEAYLAALATLGSIYFFITVGTVDIATSGDKRLGTNITLASTAVEAAGMPLLALIFHLLHACSMQQIRISICLLMC